MTSFYQPGWDFYRLGCVDYKRMNRTSKIRDKLVATGAISATVAVVAVLATCCIWNPDRTVFYHLYRSFSFDSHGEIFWPILLVATILIIVGVFRLVREYRQPYETALFKLLPGLIGAIITTALSLMVTPAGTFIKVVNAGSEVTGMALLMLYLFCVIFIGIVTSWRLWENTRRRKPLLVLCSPPRCEVVDIARSQWY